MKIGTKVITRAGFFGEITSINSFHRKIANVKLDNTGQTLGYFLDSLKKRNPKPIKLKKFSAWK